MDRAEADSRFGATAVRALEDAIRLAGREPRVALSQARKAAEAVALHLYAREIGDPDDAPKRLMLDDLLKQLVKARQIPEGVAMHFGTVQRYGNYGAHPQADDASVGNTVAFNQPCVESLRFIARWYLKDRLGLTNDEISASVRDAVFGATSPPPPPSPARAAAGDGGGKDDRFGLVGTCLEGKYQIDSAVAEGGFGAVYRGTHVTLEKPVAVKVLKAPANASEAEKVAFVEDFAREAKTVARMEHPAIVKVVDFGVSAMPSGVRAPWMVLDWLSGETLQGQLKRRRGSGGRAPVECMVVMRPVIQAIAYAHDQGIAHRDIKPANIILTGTRDGSAVDEARASRTGSGTLGRSTMTGLGRHGEVAAKVLDFGIAKVMHAEEGAASGETQTKSSFSAFSTRYAAPEQVSGTRTGPWTDVHALALVLVEMLVDQAPYEGDDAQEIYMSVLSPLRPTPAKFGVDVGPWELVLAKALSPKPVDRYANAEAFLEALEASVPETATRVGGSGALSAKIALGAGSTDGVAANTGQTFRGAEVLTRSTSARPSRRVLVGGAVAALLLLGVGAFAALRNSDAQPARPATAPHAALAHVEAPAPEPAHPAMTPAAPAVDASAALAVVQTDAAAPEPEADQDEGRRGHRRRSHRRRSDEGEPAVVPVIVVQPPAASAPRPTRRIHAD